MSSGWMLTWRGRVTDGRFRLASSPRRQNDRKLWFLLVIGQIFYLLNSRYKFDSSLSLKAHLDNPYLGLGIAAVVLAQALFTYAPPFQALFDTEAIPLDEWPWLFLGGLVFFLVVEAEKLVIRLARQSPADAKGSPCGP